MVTKKTTLSMCAVMALCSEMFGANINIPAQSLSSALSELGSQANIQLLVTEELTKGKSAPEVKGDMDAKTALERLLKGSGLEAGEKDGVITVQKAGKVASTTLESIEIVAKPKEGSAEAGYKVETVKNVGPWGEKKLLDTPYSMSVASDDLLGNTISSNPVQIFKIMPTTQVQSPYDTNGQSGLTVEGLV